MESYGQSGNDNGDDSSESNINHTEHNSSVAKILGSGVMLLLERMISLLTKKVKKKLSEKIYSIYHR